MRLNQIVENSKGKFLIRTVPSSDNIEFGNGYETQVHPIVNGEPNIYRCIDYKHSENNSKAFETHQVFVDWHSKL